MKNSIRIKKLEQERILETRVEEKLRLESKITARKTERHQVEMELTQLEAKLEVDNVTNSNSEIIFDS